MAENGEYDVAETYLALQAEYANYGNAFAKACTSFDEMEKQADKFDSANTWKKIGFGVGLVGAGLMTIAIAPAVPAGLTALGYTILEGTKAAGLVISGTMATGGVLTLFGTSDVNEAVTGYNPMLDLVYKGNTELYTSDEQLFLDASMVAITLGAYGEYVTQMSLYNQQLTKSSDIADDLTGNPDGKVCFVAGTKVLTATGLVAIETIEVGDIVIATDPETGETSEKKVNYTFINETDELVHLTVNGEEITSTPGHRFYAPEKGWTSAIDLRAGDILRLVNGEYVTVEAVQHEILEFPVKIYNLEVDDFHTYFVGEQSVLVHNNGCGQDGASEGGTDDVYNGVRQASEYLGAQGVPRQYRKQILESFDVRTIKLETAGESTYGLRFYGGNANAEGRYLFETFSPLTDRANLALPYEWNSMTGIQQFQVRNGTTMITGAAASQSSFGAQYIGSANQWYINNLEDLIICQ